ncbi:MAG: DNA helicase PcrA [Actinomycetaceae bacterium]|nr:DNA helicase PcrA [Actinomycetaceae bacterium]
MSSEDTFLNAMEKIYAQIQKSSDNPPFSAVPPVQENSVSEYDYDVSEYQAEEYSDLPYQEEDSVVNRLSSIIEGLNVQQKEAVEYEGPSLLVIAGAGSGKTRVLTSRIAYLISSAKAQPYDILAITFTNKAAREMRERLENMLGKGARSMWISTFHSACVRILREQHEKAGLRSSFTIYDSQDSQRLIKNITQEQGIDNKGLTPKVLALKISDLKNDLVTPDIALQYAQTRDDVTVASVYKEYQRQLVQAHAVDFDDLIMKTVLLIQNNEEVRNYYRNRFRYVLVDEYQDTNHAQYVLIKELVGGIHDEMRSSLTVVGDADQSIYAFRGATIRNIEEFEKDFSDAHTVVLEQNYRSTQAILSAANAVIAHNEGRHAKKLWTDQGQGEKIVGYVADSENDEAYFVVDEIQNLISSYSYRDIAVFYRTNSQSRALEEMFVRMNIPYKVIGGTKFYDRKEIKDALAYLHAVVNQDDTISLRRIINEPKRGIGKKAEDLIMQHAYQWSISFGQALEDAVCEIPDPVRGSVDGLSARARSSLKDFLNILHEAREMNERGASPADILDELMEKTGYVEALRQSKDIQDESRLENLAELHAVASDYMSDNPESTLADWLSEISLVADSDQLTDDAEGFGYVTLMTVHTAKGLEFPVVFLTGMEEGVFPHMRSLDSQFELSEERRLAYVALTRARKLLYLSRCAVRSSWGKTQHFGGSRFINEIPEELILWKRKESAHEHVVYPSYSHARRNEYDDDFGEILGSGKKTRQQGKLGVSVKKKENDVQHGSLGEADTAGFVVGDRVKHASFGIGTIESFEGKGKSTVAHVRFPLSTKRLMLRYAPIEKVQ